MDGPAVAGVWSSDSKLKNSWNLVAKFCTSLMRKCEGENVKVSNKHSQLLQVHHLPLHVARSVYLH